VSAIASVVLPLVLLVLVLRIAFRSGRRLVAFNPRRASTGIRSRTGGNATGVLASVVVAQTGLSLASTGAAPGAVTGLLFGSVMIAFVFALAVADKEAGFLLTIIGVAAALLGTTLDFGLPGALLTLALSLPLIWIFGLARGFTR
jgi:hypothetical protein